MNQLDPLKGEPYPHSAWDDAKFTIGGLLVIALPIALLIGLVLLLL